MEFNQEQLEFVINIATEKAISVYKEEQRKENMYREKSKVKKTREMLQSYRRVKALLKDEESISEEEQIELRWKFIEDLMTTNISTDKNRMDKVISLKEKQRQENLYIIKKIEDAVELYRRECEKSNRKEAKRRYQELEMMYLTEQEYEVKEIAEKFKVSDKAIYKDMGIVCKILSVYLFGI